MTMPGLADMVDEDRLREMAGEYLVRAGEVLRTAGAVELLDVERMRVSAHVEDAGVRRATELAVTPDGLAIRCDCPAGSAGGWCPHAAATAIEIRDGDPRR